MPITATGNPIDYTAFYENSPYREEGMTHQLFLDLTRQHTDYGQLRKSWPPDRANFSGTGSGWVVFHPRPTRSDNPDLSPESLAKRQAQWDDADAKFRRNVNAMRDQKLAKEAQVKAAQEAHEQRQVERMTADLRKRYFSVPGATEEGFQKALPDLMERHRQNVALGLMPEDEATRTARRASRPRM